MSNVPARCVTPGGERFQRWREDRSRQDAGITAAYFECLDDRDRNRASRQLVALFDGDLEAAANFVRQLFRAT
jgi:hypothetical protein|tara:strand:+ start:2513 stop:2731 length:219 start_codon:yes stop_codon:yes gene_type:complete